MENKTVKRAVERECQNCCKCKRLSHGAFMGNHLKCREREEAGVDPIIWGNTPVCGLHRFDEITDKGVIYD